MLSINLNRPTNKIKFLTNRNYFLKSRKSNEKIKFFCITLSDYDFPKPKMILTIKYKNIFFKKLYIFSAKYKYLILIRGTDIFSFRAC